MNHDSPPQSPAEDEVSGEPDPTRIPDHPETGEGGEQGPTAEKASEKARGREKARTEKLVAEHRRSRRRSRGRLLLLQSGVFVTFLLVWWAINASGWIKPLYLPSPAAVVRAFIDSNSCAPIAEGSERIVCGSQGYFMWEHLLHSLRRMGVGVGLAIVVGPLLGFLMGSIPWVRASLDPYLNFLRSLPPLAYIGLVIVWFGIGDASKYLLLFLAAFPPITIATINGIRSIREDRLHAARTLGANKWQMVFQVILPSTLPDLINGIRIATGFAWTTVVAAELNNGNPGIGSLAYLSGEQLNTALTIACIIVIGIAAVALDAALSRLGQFLVPWQGKV